MTDDRAPELPRPRRVVLAPRINGLAPRQERGTGHDRAATTRPAETQRERRGHVFYPPDHQAAAIPPLYGTEDTPTGEKVLHLHYFAGACDWWIAEYDPATGAAFGYACLGGPACAEWGHLDLPELEQVCVRSGLLIVERDLHWRPTCAGDVGLPGRNAT